MASRSRLRLWRQKRRNPLRPWDAAPRVRLSATRNTSRIGPSTRSLPSTYAWPSFIRSGGRRKRSADGLGTPILTLGSLARSKARPFHNSRRSGMAADRLSFAISLSRRCSRNMSFHRGGKHHSIAGRRASYTMEQGAARPPQEDGMSRFTVLAFAALFALASWAQYPSRPIKLIVPIPPGGAPDISARVIGQRLSELVAQPVVVENRPGGNGSIHQLAMEMLKQRAGINLVHVPYKGGAPAATATVAGEVAAMFSGTSSAPQIKAGRLRALAMTGAQRSALFPDLPTISEFYPGYEVTIWLGLFAAAGTPEALLARLHAEVNKLLAEAETKARLNAAGGLEAYTTTAPEFAALIRRDYDKYGKLVRDVGVKVD